MTPYFEHAGITIYHGDALAVLDEWEGLQTPRFDLLLTDPPYGIYKCGGKWGRKADLAWDQEPVPHALLTIARAVSRYHIIWGR